MKNPIIPVDPYIITSPEEKRLDYAAICCFAATGFFLDNDTYYTNQKVLRAATELVDGVERPYFNWHYSPRDISFADAVDEFSHLFDTITKELTRNKRIILPLSGGLDSRSQAAALKGVEGVNTYSYKFSGSFDETHYGKEIARRMGWNFKEYVIPQGYLWERIDALADINRCCTDFVNPRQMAIVEEYPSMGDVFYLGHWGDVLFDDMGISDDASFDDQLRMLYKKIVKKGGIELADSLWKYWQLPGKFEDYLYERLKALLSDIDISNANARIRAFKSLYWAPRWTSVNLSVFKKYHPLALPYYDDRMCEFICTVPEKYLAGRQIQIEYIKRKAPELAAIAWQTFDPCNLYNYKKYDSSLNRFRRLVGYAQRKTRELATGHPCVLRNWEIQYLGSENDKMLQQSLFANSGVAPLEVCQEYYKKFKDGNHATKVWYAHPISMLLTLSKKCE